MIERCYVVFIGVMEMLEDSIPRSHEHYLRHLLLLGQAAPLALNALIKREESKHRKTVNNMIRLLDCSTIPSHLIYTKSDSWSTRTLCDVICALFGQALSASEPEIMNCVYVITEQRNDMDKYAKSAALSYEVFEKKWNPLRSSLLELIKDTDSQTGFECKRMIHSFKLEPVLVNSDLIKKLRETTDVDSHVKIAIQEKVVAEIHGKRVEMENKEICDLDTDGGIALEDEVADICDDESTPYGTVTVFTEQLRDTFAYVDEPAILTCKLNVAKATVRWRKDYAPLEETETQKFVNDQHSHWLAISNTQLTDTGLYSCVCGNATTSASLKITEKPLKIVKELHVAETECRENMDISLVCAVNLHAKRPVWKHNGNIIVNNNRIFASSQELEHKLTILNARFGDEGEYTVDFGEVSSRTPLTIKGNVDLLHKKQLAEELYRNWVRGALGLKYLKIGLENVANRFIQNQHSEFLTKLLANGTVCTYCTSEKLLPFHSKADCKKKSKCVCMRPQNRMRCPNGFCSQLFDLIIDSHRFFEPLLSNSDVQIWSSDPWSVATCYISTTGYRGKKSATEVDCAGLLSLFINNTIFQKYIGEVDINGETDVFKKAKDARNEILHNPTYELSNGQLDDCITYFKNVLEIKDEFGESPLLTEPGVTPALCSLNELQNHQIDIYMSEDLEQQIRSLREHAMDEVAERFEAAEKEKDMKIQQLEEKLRLAEQELQLMNEMRTSLQKKKFTQEQKVPFELELHIQVLKSTTEALVQANQLVFRLMKVDVARHNNEPDVATTSTDLTFTKTSLAVQRILSYIYNVEDIKIGDVVNSGSSIDLKIQCFSCMAIDQMLALINGTKFQQVKFELRKYLELEGGAEKPYEVVANCSSQSLNNTRKRLYERGFIKEVTTDFSCDKHIGMRIVSYCSDHDQLCCATCRETVHRACVGLDQVVSVQTFKENDQRCLSVKSKIGVRNIRIFNQKGVSDGYKCSVLKTAKLPKGKFLLADRDNSRLKKLDSVYKLVGYCDLPDSPYDICYLGNRTAAVSLGEVGIQRVSVSGKMKLLDLIKVDHFCLGLDFHLDTLYVTDKSTVYTYDKDVSHQRVLYKKLTSNPGESLGHVVVSDDGKMIYLSDVNGGLVTISSDGNHLSTLKNDVLQGASGICLVNDGTILVTDENTHSVHQVDYKGERVIGTVITEADSPQKPWSVCYNEQHSRLELIVGYFEQNHVTVFELQ